MSHAIEAFLASRGAVIVHADPLEVISDIPCYNVEATMEQARARFPGLRYYEIQTVLKNALGHVMKYHRFKFYTNHKEE